MKNYFVFQTQIGKAHSQNQDDFFTFFKNTTFLKEVDKLTLWLIILRA